MSASDPNYMSPAGYARLSAELESLVKKERPQVVNIVTWAASNGDRSENGDYLYGKKRLREIDRRVRFLMKRLDIAQVVDNTNRDGEQIFFGATVVVYYEETEEEKQVTIVGSDEIDTERGYISWLSPLARALLKRSEGDTVLVQAPDGLKPVVVLSVSYPPITFEDYRFEK